MEDVMKLLLGCVVIALVLIALPVLFILAILEDLYERFN
jgi:hypothetical protein